MEEDSWLMGFWKNLFTGDQDRADAKEFVADWFWDRHLARRAIGEIPCAPFCKWCPESYYAAAEKAKRDGGPRPKESDM